MFQFTPFPSHTLCIHVWILTHYCKWVPPFGDLRIKGYLLLPAAYRSLSRLSSALSAKASTLRSLQLNQCFSHIALCEWLVICWRIIFFNGLDNFYYYLWCLACLPSSSLMTSDGKIVISYHSIWSFQGTFGNFRYLMEMEGFEPLTPCLQGRCSPNWATPPFGLPLVIQFRQWA